MSDAAPGRFEGATGDCALDPGDEALAPFRGLAAADPRELVVVEGEIPLRRLLASGLGVRAVLCTPTKRSALAELLDPLPTVHVRPPAVLRAIVGYAFHRGVIALAERPPVCTAVPTERIAELHRAGTSLVVVAERVTDAANLGALVRNARAFGIDLVITDAAGADVFSRKSVRSSAGHVFELPVVVAAAPVSAARTLADALGGTLAAAVAPGVTGPPPIPIASWCAPPHVALAFGNEGEGLSERLLAAADVRVTIPLAPGADSLNVAAASAVLLHALRAGRPPAQRTPARPSG